MALDNQFGKGIGVAAGFDLGAQKPLDARVAVNTIAERDAHVENNRAYEGMLVYVAEANMTYQLVKGEEEGQLVWKEFGFNQNDFDGAFEESIKGIDDRLKAVEEDLAQGGEIEARIAQAESDIDGLQGLVGNPAGVGENDEEVEATGLHLAVQNAQEQADKGVADAAAEKLRAEGQEAAIRQEMADAIGNYAVEADPENGVEAAEAAGLRKEIAEADAAIRAEMEQAHEDINGALEQAVKDLQDEIDADVEVEKLRAEGQEAAIRQEMADAIGQHAAEGVEASGLRKEMDDAVAAEKARAEEQEGKIREELAAEKLALQGEIDADVEVEKLRAEGVEAGLAGRLDVIEGEGEGSIKKAVKDLADRHDQEMEEAAEQVGKDLAALKEELQGEIDADVAAEAKLREDADKALDERVKPLEEFVAAQPGVDEAQNDRIKALEDDAPVKQAAIEAAQAAADQAQQEVDAVEERATDLEGRMDAAEEDIARLDGAVDVEGSVKKQIKDAVDAINADAEALEARVKANEDDIAEINGVIGVPAVEADENGEGGQAATGMHKLIADEDARVLGEAKAHAEQKIAELVDSAPDAMNTLNELAKAINDNKDVYDAYVEEHNQAMAALKEELQGEIDADVKVVADELAKQKDAAQEGTLAKQIADEVARADAEEKAIRQLVADEKLALQGEIDADVEVEKLRAEGQEAAIRQELADEAAEIRGEMADAIGNYAVEADPENAVEAVEASGLRKEIAEADAAIRAEMEQAHGEMDQALEDAVKAEKERAEEQEGLIREEMADAIGNYAVEADPENGVEAVEAAGLRKEIAEADAAEQQRAEGQEAAIRQELADAIAQEVEDRNAAILVEQQRAEGQEAAIRNEMAAAIGQHAVEADPENGVEAVEASGLRKEMDDAVAAEQARALGQEAAIRQEFADADEALHALIKGEMAAVIQSLSASITENGMLRIALGGIEGDDVLVIREQQIPMITDDEIDAIIAGLDAPVEGE